MTLACDLRPAPDAPDASLRTGQIADAGIPPWSSAVRALRVRGRCGRTVPPASLNTWAERPPTYGKECVMDPNANIAEQQQIAQAILAGTATKKDVDRLAELVVAVHEWRLNGGFDPYTNGR